MQRYEFTRKIFIVIMTILILLNFYIWVFLPNYNTLELKPHIYKSFDSSFKKVDYSLIKISKQEFEELIKEV